MDEITIIPKETAVRRTSFIILMEDHLNGMVECGWGNGYVAVFMGHKYFGHDYDDVPVDVHYGLTFARPMTDIWTIDKWRDAIVEGYGTTDIVPEEWWVFGWDTKHLDDNIYKWPKEAVLAETERLREQLEALRYAD